MRRFWPYIGEKLTLKMKKFQGIFLLASKLVNRILPKHDLTSYRDPKRRTRRHSFRGNCSFCFKKCLYREQWFHENFDHKRQGLLIYKVCFYPLCMQLFYYHPRRSDWSKGLTFLFCFRSVTRHVWKILYLILF